MIVHNPQVESQLQVLTEMCCDAVSGERTEIAERSEPILKSLLMSGYARNAESTLQVELENRAKEKCLDRAMHRGAELSAVAKHLQDKFNKLALWESKQPETSTPAKTANVSAAIDV